MFFFHVLFLNYFRERKAAASNQERQTLRAFAKSVHVSLLLYCKHEFLSAVSARELRLDFSSTFTFGKDFANYPSAFARRKLANYCANWSSALLQPVR
jgi:hypothetical protein